jgi:SAM-dependent methyltransferase
MLHTDNDPLIKKTSSSERETEYDKYFDVGVTSIYRKRFGKRLFIPNEKKVITEAFNIASKNSTHNKFKILDFGCGDGRLFNLLENLNKKLKSNINSLEIICYDPSLKGLELLKNTLIKKNYNLNYSIDEIKSSGYIKYKLSKNNINIVIIHGNACDNLKQIKSLIGSHIDLAVLMFGVLSHIIGKNNRINLLATIKTSLNLNGVLVLNVPTKKHFIKDLYHYNYLRENHLTEELSSATEEGDIYYLRKSDNKIIKNYYHIYNFKELTLNIKSAGLFLFKSGISSINHTPVLSNKLSFLIKLDTFFSRFF